MRGQRTHVRKALPDPEKPRIPVNMGEIGRTGLRQWQGIMDEEWMPALRSWEQRRKVYREMVDNDPTVGALLYLFKYTNRQIQWFVDGEDDDPRTEFLQKCKDDLKPSWPDFISDVTATVLPWGFAPYEIVYTQREDGQIGWEKFASRHPDTLDRWLYAKNNPNKLLGMRQLAAPDYKTIDLPLEKLLLFRTESVKDSPEGRSILRNAYRPWYLKKHIEQIEAIGLERDLTGLCVVWGPPECLDPGAGSEWGRVGDRLKSIATNVKRDEQQGVVMPLAFDDNGNKLYDISLLASPGQHSQDSNLIVGRYDRAILMSALADFILVGHEKVGSFSLNSTKTNLWSVADGALLDQIDTVLNNDAIPRLLELNGMDTEDAPKFKHGDIEIPDMTEIAALMTSVAGAGMPLFPDFELENRVRQLLNLKPLDREEWEEKQEEAEERAEQELQREMELASAGKEPAGEKAPAKDEKPEPKEKPTEKALTPIVVTPQITFTPTTVTVPAPNVTITQAKAADVNITLPAPPANVVNIEAAKAPDVTVHPAEIKVYTPDVTVTPQITVEAAKPADVKVELQAPAPVVVPAPVVNITSPEAPDVNVTVEAAKVEVPAPVVTVEKQGVDMTPIADAIRDAAETLKRPSEIKIIRGPDGQAESLKPSE